MFSYLSSKEKLVVYVNVSVKGAVHFAIFSKWFEESKESDDLSFE